MANTIYPKLDPEFKAKWIEALRSGKYKQGKGRLYTFNNNNNESTYCCLGVAGLVCGLSNETLDGYYSYGERCSNNRYESFEPIEIPVQLIYRHNKTSIARELWTMNDIDERTFEQIADWIEENL